MKYINKIQIAVALMAMGSASAWAQETIHETVHNMKVDTVTLHYNNKYYSRFKDNWSVEVLGSARVLFAEEDAELKFGERICPAFQLGVMKEFSPDVSLRLLGAYGAFTGWNTGAPGLYKAQAGWSEEDPVRAYLMEKGDPCTNGYNQNMRYFTIGADVMVHLWNVWTSHNQIGRKWNPYFFFGVEYFQLLKHEGYCRTYKLGAHVGFKCDVRLTKRLDLTGEVAASIHPATFDNEIGKGHRMDFYAGAAIGLKVRLGKQGYRYDRVLQQGEYMRLGQVVTGITESYQLEGAKKVIPGDLFAPSIVFDDNAETYSQELQMVNLYRMAEYMKQYPNMKISVIGNTHKVGQSLAQRRAEIIRQTLINRYGIAADRLKATTLDVTAEYGVTGDDQTVNFAVTK